MAWRLTFVVTHPVTAHLLLRGQLAFLRQRGFEPSVIASPDPLLQEVGTREGVEVVGVPMERAVGGARDVASLASLGRALRRLRPHVVNASTPKAGLLGMMAAATLRVPVRVYLLRGLRLETERGLLRGALAATERVASRCAHEVVCVSESLREAYVRGGFASREKTRVLGLGSSNGVDVARFTLTDDVRARAREVAASVGLDTAAPTIGFVGRFDPDKNLDLLLDAFAELRERVPRAQLLFVGGDLGGEPTPSSLAARVKGAPSVFVAGRTADVAPYYALMHVLAFPSLREGFPNVPLEAACAEVPAVGWRATGVVDAISDGVTGAIVSSRDELRRALVRYLEDPDLRAAHGRAARARAVREFAREAVWERWAVEYERLLRQQGVGP